MSGIVLAGGRSARFGRDKLSEPVRGVPMLHHAILRVAEVCGEVVVVVAPDTPDPALPAGVTARVVRDPVGSGGPLVGICAGLSVVRSELALAVGGDMPDLSPAVLRELLREAEEDSVEAVVLHDGETFRPLPCVLRVERALEEARARLDEGDRSLHALLNGLRLALVEEASWHALDPDGRTLRDVDEPEDLTR